MKKRLFSLRIAILLPYMLAIIVILTISMTLWTRDYNWLVDEQGNKVLTALSENTKQELFTFLSEPLRVNKLFAATISDQEMYDRDDMSDLQSLSTNFMKKTKTELTQLSVISYGDEKKNYVGIRANSLPGSYTLMLQDSRTKGLLNIYKNESPKSEVIASYEGYDPRTRPWYMPVKEHLTPLWSKIYINQDEKRDITISNMIPIFDKENYLKGVSEIDIKLDEIDKFLLNNTAKGSGVIYIVDKDWRVISSSSEANHNETADKRPTMELPLAVKSTDPLIGASSKHLIDSAVNLKDISKLRIDNEVHYTLVSPLEEPVGLNWKVVVVLPEIDLIGDVKARKNMVMLINLSIGIACAFAGFFLLNYLISPILKSADAAKKIANGHWDTAIETESSRIREINTLVHGFNAMSLKINESFTELLAAQDEIKHLHANEKKKLELLVSAKTEELRHAMKELIEKEKLASLGSLVSGIAHEINTPLGVAVSAGSFLEDQIKRSHQSLTTGKMTKADLVDNMSSINEGVDIINKNLHRAASLVKSFKQIAVDQNIEEKSDFYPNAYTNTILISLQPALKRGQYKVALNCDPEMIIRNYPGAFSQVITNLIMNSLIHGFSETGEGEIHINIFKESERLVLIYSDNGKGIPSDVLPKIFDPFFTTNRNKGGSGLGLNIVYNIVTSLLEGNIKCSSTLGEGTQFKIDIPL